MRIAQIGFVLASLLLLGCGKGGGVTPAEPSNWVRSSANPLIIPMSTATTIDYSAADPGVLFDPDDNKWKMWHSSTLKNRTTQSERMTIKYAEGTDGVAWGNIQIAFVVSSDPNAWDHTHAESRRS